MRTGSMPEIGWVIHDRSGLVAKECREWSNRCGFQVNQTYVINNSEDYQLFEEIPGNNTAFEFSGYAQALDLMQGDGPFVLVNDSLFRHHWSRAWCIMLHRLLEDLWLCTQDGKILGDLRRESIEFPEKPSTYWASWIFVMSDRWALQRMRVALERVIQAEWSEPSPEYEHYVKKWLNKSWWRGGWQGNPTPTAIHRKRISIRREHELSRILLMEQRLTPYSIGHRQQVLYRITRWTDRMMARYSAIRRKPHG